MNNALELLHNHASIRSYTNQLLTEEQREAIFKAANQTSSFSLLQAVSIIRITVPDLRRKVMQLSVNQPYIEEAAEFWIFCSDFHRNHQIAPEVDLEYIRISFNRFIRCRAYGTKCFNGSRIYGTWWRIYWWDYVLVVHLEINLNSSLGCLSPWFYTKTSIKH